MSGAHQARGAMHVEADVAFSRPLRHAGMQAHAHAYVRAGRKSVGGEGALGRHRRCDTSVARAKTTKKASPWVSTSCPFHRPNAPRSTWRHSASKLA